MASFAIDFVICGVYVCAWKLRISIINMINYSVMMSNLRESVDRLDVIIKGGNFQQNLKGDSKNSEKKLRPAKTV
jgi:hypothetical protein